MLTSAQLRAARALLRWSAADLAMHSGVGTATIQRMEVVNGIPSGHVKTLIALKEALEQGGVQFVGAPDDSPGVRLTQLSK